MRSRLSYSNVLATIAVVLAAGTGGAFAADLITGKDIARNAIATKHIKQNAVNSARVKDGSLLAGDFEDGELPAGATGPQGPPGEQGDQGDRGSDGADAPDRPDRCVQRADVPATEPFGGVCFETAQRAKLSWKNAADACAADARRMPSADQLWAFAATSSFAPPAEGSRYEQSADLTQRFSSEMVWEQYVTSVGKIASPSGDGREIGSHFSKEPLEFRCVEPVTNAP